MSAQACSSAVTCSVKAGELRSKRLDPEELPELGKTATCFFSVMYETITLECVVLIWKQYDDKIACVVN